MKKLSYTCLVGAGVFVFLAALVRLAFKGKLFFRYVWYFSIVEYLLLASIAFGILHLIRLKEKKG